MEDRPKVVTLYRKDQHGNSQEAIVRESDVRSWQKKGWSDDKGRPGKERQERKEER